MNSKLASLLCCLIMLVSFSGCTKVTQLVKDAQPTKAELLAEINEEHRRYEGGSSDPTPYLRHYDNPADAQKSTDYLTDTYSEYDAAKELNPEEAEEWKEEIKAAFPDLKFATIDPVSLSIACHVGPGVLAVTCQKVL